MQNTDRRSALRITRESELLGGQLTAYHTREALVVEAAFLRDDLPYFTELLGEVITKTRYSSTWAEKASYMRCWLRRRPG
jgi:ubiquinol-cytochrome c reductase core subunit 2